MPSEFSLNPIVNASTIDFSAQLWHVEFANPISQLQVMVVAIVTTVLIKPRVIDRLGRIEPDIC